MRCSGCMKNVKMEYRYCPFCGTAMPENDNLKRHTKKRGNGTGTAIRRDNGTYTARVILGYDSVLETDENGVSIPKLRARTASKSGFATRTAALQYCPTLLALKDKPKPEPQKKAPVLAYYWQIFLKSCNTKKLAPNTISSYKTAWRKLSSLHNRQVDTITVSEIVDLVYHVASSHDTINDIRTIMRGMFQLAAADRWASLDTVQCIKVPNAISTETAAFTVEEQAALWRLYEQGDMRAAIPILMISTGMMPIEARKLKIENIDLSNLQIIHAGAKTEVRKREPILLPTDIVPVMEDLIANAMPSGYLWPQDEKKWRQQYADVLEAAGCRPLRPYSCRHTTATRLSIDKNIAPKTIMRVMRWSSPKMLSRYSHTDESHVRSAVNAINQDAAKTIDE